MVWGSRNTDICRLWVVGEAIMASNRLIWPVVAAAVQSLGLGSSAAMEQHARVHAARGCAGLRAGRRCCVYQPGPS